MTRPTSLCARLLCAIACCLLFAPTSACDEDEALSPLDFYGLWVNVDSGTVRAFEFKQTSDEQDVSGLLNVYIVSSYAEGTTPTVVQRGLFEVANEDGQDYLVTNVIFATESGQVGQRYANEIRFIDDSQLILSSTSSSTGQRVFAKATALP